MLLFSEKKNYRDLPAAAGSGDGDDVDGRGDKLKIGQILMIVWFGSIDIYNSTNNSNDDMNDNDAYNYFDITMIMILIIALTKVYKTRLKASLKIGK